MGNAAGWPGGPWCPSGEAILIVSAGDVDFRMRRQRGLARTGSRWCRGRVVRRVERRDWVRIGFECAGFAGRIAVFGGERGVSVASFVQKKTRRRRSAEGCRGRSAIRVAPSGRRGPVGSAGARDRAAAGGMGEAGCQRAEDTTREAFRRGGWLLVSSFPPGRAGGWRIRVPAADGAIEPLAEEVRPRYCVLTEGQRGRSACPARAFACMLEWLL